MFLESFLHNPVLTGIFGGSIAASLLYTLRGVPVYLWRLVLWKFTCHVMISSDDPAFDVVAEWMSKQEFAAEARHLRMASRYSEHEERQAFQVSPGLGRHWFWFNYRPVFINRTSMNNGLDRYGRVSESFDITTLGTSPKLLRDVVKIIAASQNDADNYVEVHLYQNYWRKVARKEKRTMDSVVIPVEQRNRIVGDLRTFLESRDWYRKLGIPYRRGMLFTGPPGTGKTSLVLALAALFDMRVYAINLGSIKNDNDLIQAVTSVPEKAILLIEDIDVAQVKRKPDKPTKKAAETTTPATPAEEAETSITLSGLLNAIDGVFSRDGRILIMTTNHPEKLDKALMRPGRADLIEHLGELGPTEVLTMCKQFLNSSGEAFAQTVQQPITPAELQKVLLQKAAENRAVN